MIKAFLAHSFEDSEKNLVGLFKEHFDSLKKVMAFDWEDAQEKGMRAISEKVINKMKGKNLFVGIFTQKHCEISVDKFRPQYPRWLNKNKYTVMQDDIKRGVSDWMIQESGYAIGLGMKTLFIFEKGTVEIKGLHADREHIYFDRDKVGDCFPQITQALSDFLASLSPENQKRLAEEPKEDVKTALLKEDKDNSAEIQNEEKKLNSGLGSDVDYLHEVYGAVFEKNDKRIDELRRDLSKKHEKDVNQIAYWEATIIHAKRVFHNEDVLQQLRDLSQTYPKSQIIHRYIGMCLEDYRSYDEAAKEYLEAKKLSLVPKDQIKNLNLAATAVLKNGDEISAMQMLYDAFRDYSEPIFSAMLFEALAYICLLNKQDDLFLSFSEKSLMIVPNNNSLRFKLAYRYSEIGKSDFALYHYQILIQTDPSATNLNNLGVAYSELKMEAKSVDYYRQAAAKKMRLAMANIAQQYLDEGFMQEAKTILDEANKIEEDDKGAVARAISRIAQINEAEGEKEEEALKGIEAERKFRLKFSEAAIAQAIDFTGFWKGKHGDINITVSGQEISGTGQREDKSYSALLSLALIGGLSRPTEPVVSKKILHMTGTLRGTSFFYTLQISEEGSRSSTLLNDSREKYSGMGIVENGGQIISIMEKDKNEAFTFYNLQRI